MSDRGRAEALAALNVSRETANRLDRFVALLDRWSPAINLVSRSSLAEVWTRHILDSAQLLPLVDSSAHWADLGSGGGFPGLVIAILAAEQTPDIRVTLVESDRRKAAFLATVLRETGVEGNVQTARAEALAPLGSDVVSARALAPLGDLLPLAKRHLAPGGVALFPKGARVDEELAAALEHWRVSVQKHPSLTDPEAVILRIGDITRG